MTVQENPRSTLHKLQPLGCGAEVESLTSYFCRLAVSHSTSTTQLSRWIFGHFELMLEEDFDWRTRHFSGLREAAQRWSAGLSALTSVDRLDRLTFMHWKPVIAQNGLGIHRAGQFCPMCLYEDREKGATPYLRLQWEPKIVSVCHKHRIPLQTHCHSCAKSNIRHASALVIPGWCTSCHEFLGQEILPQTLNDFAVWSAEQVAELIAQQQDSPLQLEPHLLQDAIQKVIDTMYGGSSSAFARGQGFPKTTVHSWMKCAGLPTLENSLRVAYKSGFSVVDLLSGRIDGWSHLAMKVQLPLLTEGEPARRRKPPRNIDWAQIEKELQRMLELAQPIPVLSAAEQIGLDVRQLYLRCNATTRRLAARWKAFVEERKQVNVDVAIAHLRDLEAALGEQGRSLTMREARAHIPVAILHKVDRCWDVIRNIRKTTELDADWGSANDTRFRT